MRHEHSDVSPLRALCDAESAVARRRRRIASFPAGFHDPIAALSAADYALEDLAETFPGLLFALATGYGEAPARTRATRLIVSGAPLRAAATALGLPFWLRRLPPDAFVEPLRQVPGDDEFASRILNLVPAPQYAGPWLTRTLLANEVCHADGALWIARQYKGAGPSPTDPAFLHILAWIWHAEHPGSTPHRLLRRKWQPQFSARRATEEVEHWRHRLALAVALGDGLQDTWLSEGPSRGYEFVALRTAEDFVAEAARMDNCLDQYAHRLEGRAVRIFSVRKDGRSVADLEIACHEQELGMPAIAQLRAARNRRASSDVWQAAYAWLGNQPIRQADPALLRQDRANRRRHTARLWRPFLEQLSDDTRAMFAAAFGTRATLGARRAAPRPVSPANPAASMRPRRRKTTGSSTS